MVPDVDVDPRVVRTRRDVLAAAREVLLEEGWEGVTVSRVADRSGYARTTLYRHWPQRLDLLRDLIGEEARLAQVAEYQARRDVMVDGLRRMGWNVERPRAGMFVWAEIPEPWRTRMGSIDFAMKLLGEAEVAVSPGRGFGELGEGFLRLALIENEHRLRQAVRQINRSLRAERAPA